MADTRIEFIGLAAAFLTTSSFVPQAIQVLRTRDTKAISLGMYLMFTSGSCLWLAYGILIGSLSVTLANAITALLAMIILILKLKHR